jgi:hypothetical protein
MATINRTGCWAYQALDDNKTLRTMNLRGRHDSSLKLTEVIRPRRRLEEEGGYAGKEHSNL